MASYDDLKALLPQRYQDRAGNQLTSIGHDSLDMCRDQKIWSSHAPITYDFNSYGYRDTEWQEPDIWVIGDSFSMGLGQPYDETWPRQLESMISKRINKACCNGAGNDWIDRAYRVIRSQSNAKILIMWSFVYRHMKKYDSDIVLQSGYEKLSKSKDIDAIEKHVAQRWIDLFDRYKHEDTLFSFVPGWNQSLSITAAERDPRYIPYKMKDFGRDGYHFGPITSKDIASEFADRL